MRTAREALRDIGDVETGDHRARMQIAEIIESVGPEDGPPAYVAGQTSYGDIVLEWDQDRGCYTEFATASSLKAAGRLAQALIVSAES